MAASKMLRVEPNRAGRLRYRCICGALIKIDVPDVEQGIQDAFRTLTPKTHQCDETHVNIASLIGGTFTEPQPEE